MEAAGRICRTRRSAGLRDVLRISGTHGRHGKVIYPLDEVLLLCLLAVLAGAETFVDIARFGNKKIELLRRVRRSAMARRRMTTSETIPRCSTPRSSRTRLRRLGRQADRRVGDLIAMAGVATFTTEKGGEAEFTVNRPGHRCAS